MKYVTTAPDYVSSLVEGGVVKGPPLGPAIESFLFGENALKLAPDLVLANLLHSPWDVAVPNAVGAGRAAKVTFLPGHVGYKPLSRDQLNNPANYPDFVKGPRPRCADLMVIGKHPGFDEDRVGCLFTGATGVELYKAIAEAGLPPFADKAYFTNLCRFNPPKGSLKKSFINESRWFLWAEIQIVRPKLILLLGGEVIKYFHGKNYSVTKARGSFMPHYTLDATTEEEIEIQTFCTMHPAAVAREQTMRPGLSSDLSKAYSFLSGETIKRSPTNYTEDYDSAILNTVDKLQAYVDECFEKGHKKFSIDCEWSGRSPHSDGVLLTIQLSHEPNQAVLIPIHRHMRVAFPDKFEYTKCDDLIEFKISDSQNAHQPHFDFPNEDDETHIGYLTMSSDAEVTSVNKEAGVEVLTKLIPVFEGMKLRKVQHLLNKLLHRDGVRVGGQNFRADFPWLKKFGVDLTQQYLNGFDTINKHHMIFESGDQSLSALTLKYSDLGRYDLDLTRWKSDHSTVVKADGGYGTIPERILYPYALADADVTSRSDAKLDEEIQSRTAENPDVLCELVRGEMRANMGILEMEETGLLADRARIIELAKIYEKKRDELTEQLRELLNWSEFNPRSVQHCKEMLFGAEFNGKKRDNPDEPIVIRPKGAVCCRLTPIKTTGKPSKDWAKIVAAGEQNEHSPSTDKETLGILSEYHEAANRLRQIRFVDQVVKTYVSSPQWDDEEGAYTEGGLLRYLDNDDRVRTSILQLTETGRWSSSRPNMQNLPKKREPELHSYFGEDEQPPKIRSVFMAPPGHVILEADYIQAELVVLALLSGDQNFWNVLMEKPEYTVLVDPETGEPHRWMHPEWVRDVRPKIGDTIPAGSFVCEYRDGKGTWHQMPTDRVLVAESRKWSRDLHAEVAISGFKMPYSAAIDGPPKAFVSGYAPDKRVAAKCLDPDTIVFEASGPTTIGNLYNNGGGYVWDGSKFISSKSVARYNAKSVTVVTRHGVVRCSSDHKFSLPDGSLRSACDLTVGQELPSCEIPETDDNVPFASVKLNPFSKSIGSGPCDLVLNEDWCYFAGLIAGDGTRSGSDYGTGQYLVSHGAGTEYSEWQEAIKKSGECIGIPMILSGTVSRPDCIRCGSKIVGRYLDDLGLGGKGGKRLRVPWWVLRGGKRAALSYLAGLIDTDGTIAQMERRSASMSICTKDAVFAGQLVCLARTLGVSASISLSWNKTYERNYYKVCFRNDFILKYWDCLKLRCPRKRERWLWHYDDLAHKKRSPKPLTKNEVLAIEPGEVIEVLDVEVDDPSHLYVQGGLLGHNSVNFGIPYGRSAGAVARELKQEGVKVTESECQAMIDGYLDDYKLVARFLDVCSSCVTNPKFLATPFGRRRRFQIDTDDTSLIAQQQREARNFPIQSTVAECLNRATWNCWNMRPAVQEKYPNFDFRQALGVHDALIFQVPVDSIPYMMVPGGFIDVCMSKHAPIPRPDPTICNGLYANADPDRFPYEVGVDKEIFLRWDEKPDKKALLDMGVCAAYVE